MAKRTDRPRSYLDRDAVGKIFGVTAPAVRRWQERYADFPVPDITLGRRELPGWHPEREPEIRAWHSGRPGQGAPGRPKPGRPRKVQADDGQDDVQGGANEDRQAVEERRRAEPELGKGWTTTSYGPDDPDRTLWSGETRVGHVRRTGKGWTAARSSGVAVTTGAGSRGIYASRIKALRALAAETDHRRRAETPHADMPLDGLPGWRLTQTQAGHDAGVWRVIDPRGQTAGQVTRDTHGSRTEWRATAGDPDTPDYQVTITPAHRDPARGRDYDLWRTRTAAAHAIATRGDER